MKATSSGPVLGVALSDVVTPEGDAEIDQVITKVRIALNPTNSYKIAGATDEGANSDRTINSTSNIRYVIGAAVIIITIYISLNFFGKLSRSGVEAIGRNPLAFKKIEFGIIINVVVGFLIAILGIAVAIYLVN
jgi:F0F1-type ATP synthase membrane subunit c/vacuolar-type H+-ATPase subunit K